jgi:hypothetical protein
MANDLSDQALWCCCCVARGTQHTHRKPRRFNTDTLKKVTSLALQRTLETFPLEAIPVSMEEALDQFETLAILFMASVFPIAFLTILPVAVLVSVF